LWQCCCYCETHLDLVTRLGLLFSFSCLRSLAALRAFFSLFFIPDFFPPTHAIERPSSSAGAGPPFLSFSSLSPSSYPRPNSSLFCPTHLDHVPSNISPLAFTRFHLDSSRSGLLSTRTPQVLVGHTLPSPGERKSSQSDGGLSDGADDKHVRLFSLRWLSRY